MAQAQKTAPPYPPFRTFWNFTTELEQRQPLPQVFEKSFFGNKSGSIRSALVAAYRFFNLLDAEKRPTSKLHELVEDPTPAKLRGLLEEGYPQVIALGLETATRGQVDQALREMGAAPSLLPKQRAFFLQAAEAVGIELGRHLTEATSNAGSSRAPSRPKRASGAGRGSRGKPAAPAPPSGRQDLLPLIVQGLVQKLPKDGEKWTPEDAAQWLDLAKPAFAFAYGFTYPSEKHPSFPHSTGEGS